MLDALGHLDRRFGMAHAHGAANEEGHIETLGKLESRLREGEGFGRIRRFEQGNVRRQGVEAGVLLVLARVHARVVGGKHDQAAVHARVGNGEQRVSGNVDADVLHRREHARTGRARTHADLDGNLFVRAPFGVHAVLLREVLERFGARRARVADADVGTRFPCALRDCLVARQELHTVSFSLCAGRHPAPSARPIRCTKGRMPRSARCRRCAGFVGTRFRC